MAPPVAPPPLVPQLMERVVIMASSRAFLVLCANWEWGEELVADYQLLDGIIFLGGGVREIVKCGHHCVTHIHLCSLVHHAVECNAGEFDKLPLFLEGLGSVGVSVQLGPLGGNATHLITPRGVHAASRDSMLCARCNYGDAGDGYAHVDGRLLAKLLLARVHGKCTSRVDTLVKFNEAWYGLKQSRKIAQDNLVKHLNKHGYVQAQTTNGLFVHQL